MSKELALQNSEVIPDGLQLELNNLINWDKENIATAVNMAVASIHDGNYDAVDALILTKKGAELFKSLDAKIRPIAEGKSVGKDYVRYNCKITEAMTGVKYDFSTCNDQEYEQLNRMFEAAKEALDARKEFLKAVTKPLELVDTDTGETFTVNPPVKSGKLGFTLTIK